MKQCKDCKKEIDKYAIACQYCGRMQKKHELSEHADGAEPEESDHKNGEK